MPKSKLDCSCKELMDEITSKLCGAVLNDRISLIVDGETYIDCSKAQEIMLGSLLSHIKK